MYLVAEPGEFEDLVSQDDTDHCSGLDNIRAAPDAIRLEEQIARELGIDGSRLRNQQTTAAGHIPQEAYKFRRLGMQMSLEYYSRVSQGFLDS